ncbi:MAG TPA: hypothetical protein VHL80_06845 [Polyangia bacterium]|nr:hypothetical protein [Polyangia bacterium]
MRKLTMGVMAIWLGTGAAGRAFAHEGHGESVKLADTPSAVQTAFGTESKGGSVEEVRKETLKDGKTVYWGEVVKNGKGTELKVSETGKVLHRGKSHDESKEKGEPQERK